MSTRWYSFQLEVDSTPGPQCGRKDYVNEKFHWNGLEWNPRPSNLYRNAWTNCATATEHYYCVQFNWQHERWRVGVNTLWTGDADLRLYITTVQDGWRKSEFLTRAWFPRTIHLITQYMEHFSEWSCWRMFIETRVFGEYFLKISVHENS